MLGKHNYWIWLSAIIILSGCGIVMALDGTSPYVQIEQPLMNQEQQLDSSVITFSEYPVGTYITNQYSNYGIIFGGDTPYIENDGSNPTSPVLSGTPRFFGAIEGRFVNPNDGVSPVTVTWFSLDAGYFDEVESTRLEWFDLADNKLGEYYNTSTGIEKFYIEGFSIARWRIQTVSQESAGFAIDNVEMSEPTCIQLQKSDNVPGCVYPGNKIRYTISYNYPSGAACGDFYNVEIIDYLPDEIVQTPSAVIPGQGGIYDQGTNTVTWALGTLTPGVSGYVTVLVEVASGAEQGSVIKNLAELTSDSLTIAQAQENTNVCCVGPKIIYVDNRVTGGNHDGTSWQNAYNTLQEALGMAPHACGSQIWVAGGPYTVTESTFNLVEGISIYGHFKGGVDGESSIEQRDMQNHTYETILRGSSSDYVVTASGLSLNTVFDGFTVTAGSVAGIYLKDGGLTLKHCIITGNDSDATDGAGIKHEETNNNINSDMLITDCIIYNNGYYGILLGPWDADNIIIKNCTIAYNTTEVYGQRYGVGINPGYYSTTGPTVSNCIIWGHSTEYEWYGWDSSFLATYSIIQEDYADQYSGPGKGTGNIPNYGQPENYAGFVNPSSSNYHITVNSPCKNAGDPGINPQVLEYLVQTDIDGDSRVLYGRIDIGADEYMPAPVAWWKLDDGTGTTATDSMGNFNGQLIYGPVWTEGILDGGLSLDGINDYVNVAHNPTLNITGDITISAWVWFEHGGANPDDAMPIVTKTVSNGARNNPYDFRTQGINNQLTLVRADAYGHEYVYSLAPISIQQWHHVLVKVENKVPNFYVDGVITAKTPTAPFTKTPTGNSNPLLIGKRPDYRWFHGKIDDVRIYDRALTDEEIQMLFEATQKEDLEAWWQFNEGTGSSLADSTGHGFTGTISGGTWLNDPDKNWCLDFDGINDYVSVAHNPALNITGDITISTWVRFDRVGTNPDDAMAIVNKTVSNGAYNNPFDFRTQGVNNQLTLVRADATGHEYVYSLAAIPKEEWHHLVIRVENKVPDFYLDGAVTGKTPTAPFIKTPTGNTNPLYIGKRSDGLYLDGRVQKVRIYQRALTPAEILRLFQNKQ
jgi:hypothetical protein